MPGIVVVKVITGKGWEGLTRETLEIDDQEVMSVGPLSECPEDAILERDLVGPSDFSMFLKQFLIDYKGKKVKFVYEDKEEEDNE